MSQTVLEATNIMDVLPESEQKFALEFLKKLIRAWDPDFTKLTPAEAKRLKEANEEYARGEYVDVDI